MYKEIIELYKDKLDDFFKNVSTFDNQLDYNEFNDECLKKMFEENNSDNPFTVKELKERIPELKATCKNVDNIL